MTALSSSAQEVLRRICAAYAARPFAVERVERLRPAALCRAELQLAMLELRQAGLLELRQKIWGEQLYQIPARQLAAIQWSCFPHAPKPLPEAAVTVEYAADAGLAGQLFRALVFTAQHGLPLTAKGSIHKKHASRLAALLAVQDKHLSGLLPPAAERESLPLAVTVLVDLMLVLGLIGRQESAYQLDMEQLESWLGLSEPQMTSILYNVAMNRYGIEEPAPQHFRYLISSPAFPPGNWYALGDVLKWMSQAKLAAEQPSDTLQTACLAWLGCLAGFGWCELGYTDDRAWCFRWTGLKPLLAAGEMEDAASCLQSGGCGSEDGRAATGDMALLIVQPDFEVLVPPDVPYRLRWRLAGCAELLYTDELWSFRLSREKLEEAAEQGQPPESVIGWLASHASGGLPAQVELTLKQWAGSIGRTAWSEVILLACRNEADAADIAAHPRLQDSLTRVGPLHFTVQADSTAQVRKELAAAGLAPPRLIGGREGESAAHKPRYLPDNTVSEAAPYVLPVQEGRTGLLGSGAVPQPLPLAAADAEEFILPGEDDVPQMWLRDWREYHSTTAQKVMEQALAWGVKVRLSLADQICDFIPEQLRGNPWRVAGGLMPAGTAQREEAELAPGDWKEMQLLVPEQRRNSSSA